MAPKPSTPPATPPGDLRLVRADALVSSAATAPALPEMDFELLPTLEAPEVIEPAAEPAAPEPVAGHAPEPVEALVERGPVPVELVSQEGRPASARGEVEIINPDRTMPVMSEREVPSLEIPAPIHNFAPTETTIKPATRTRSKAPLFIGVGLVAAAAAVIGFFVLKPSGDAPAPRNSGSVATPRQAASGPAVSQTTPPAPSAPVAASVPTGASTGLGGDIQTRKPKRQSSDSSSKESIGDGLEPPPAVLPAAPKLGKIGDAAALPTVETGATLKMLDRANALERQRRLIDSSMRQ